ncbi:hypothetical protein KKI93_21830 [Xenorhabdus bovienii]|uniref:hypothetical protein n=1 Tax=Xenorhabdus bovienii TaxID=40576 RepID=UPI0023B32488|nr:hypothetical protein [Xenorhabdus bovienii]MDE9566583.1 hypothetical protein [Xenorhabdus bovienii]
MFVFAEFERILRTDNPSYENIRRSSLHTIIERVRRERGRGTFNARQLAEEMVRVPTIKWQKYSRTRKYLMREYPKLREQLHPQLVNFCTSRWEKGAYGAINHTLRWQSSPDILDDLAHILVREKVCWQIPAHEVQEYVERGYRDAGIHNGIGNNVTSPGNLGLGCDFHDALGPFNTPNTLHFTGPGKLEFVVTQVYQQSDNNGLSWRDIPNSAYQIQRVLSHEGNQRRITIHKENQSNPADICRNTSVLP